MLRQALDFPTSGERGARSLLVGSALLVLVALLLGAAGYLDENVASVDRTAAVAVGLLAVLPLLAVRGYYYRALSAAATAPAPEAPPFGGVVSLFRQGVFAVLVSVAYAVPAAVLFALAAGATRLPTTLDANVALVGESLGALAALLGIVAVIAALYLTPAALAYAAREESAAAALHARSVGGVAATEDYAVGWVLAVVLQWVFAPIALALTSLLVGFVLYFLTGVAARYVWGASVGTARGFAAEPVPVEGITPPSSGGGVPFGDDELTPAVRRVRAGDSDTLPDDAR